MEMAQSKANAEKFKFNQTTIILKASKIQFI